MTETILTRRRAPARALPKGRHPILRLWLAYTVLFALLAGVWIAIFAVNGKSFIWYADTVKQHYPALVYYGRWLREAARCLLTGAAIPTWDMSIGLGADVVGTLSYYVIGDPLNLLAALVPSQYGEQLLEGLMLLRIYLAGLAFLPFSLHHGNSRFGTLLGAVAYAFCAWSLQTALTEPLFIIPMYCFPLVLLGADFLFEGRRPTLYIAAIALAALSNFLFFYMVAVLLILYAVAQYFRRYGIGQLRTLWPLLGKFVGFSLVGIAIAAVTLLPTVFAMFGSARFALDRQVTSYPFTMYWKLIANLTTAGKVDEYSTYCGISAVAVLAVMILFARRRQNTILKAAWLILLAMLMTPWAGKILNGFFLHAEPLGVGLRHAGGLHSGKGLPRSDPADRPGKADAGRTAHRLLRSGLLEPGCTQRMDLAGHRGDAASGRVCALRGCRRPPGEPGGSADRLLSEHCGQPGVPVRCRRELHAAGILPFRIRLAGHGPEQSRQSAEAAGRRHPVAV